MTTIANFEEVRLLEHIKSSGLLTSFTDCFGNAQGTTDSVSGMIDLTNLADNKRAILVRQNGSDSFGRPYQGIIDVPMLTGIRDRDALGRGAFELCRGAVRAVLPGRGPSREAVSLQGRAERARGRGTDPRRQRAEDRPVHPARAYRQLCAFLGCVPLSPVAAE